MNMMVPNPVPAPTPLKMLSDTGLSMVMMRDVLLATMFRKSCETAREIVTAVCMPVPLAQELVDIIRKAGLIEATGTLHAGKSGDMGFQLTEAGKARALDALSQSEYYGAMPVPLEIYKQQTRKQSVRNVQITRDASLRSMGHLILPPNWIDQLGPAVVSGRSVLMYGPPGNGKSSIAEGIRAALGDNI